MRKICIISSFLLISVSCFRNPLTKRRELNLIPNSTLLNLSNSEYSTFLSQNKISDNAAQKEMVQSVGMKIAKGLAVDCFDRADCPCQEWSHEHPPRA